jgi:hypothetical protein
MAPWLQTRWSPAPLLGGTESAAQEGYAASGRAVAPVRLCAVFQQIALAADIDGRSSPGYLRDRVGGTVPRVELLGIELDLV